MCPYKSEQIIIAGTKSDSRIKLSPEQKKAVHILSNEGYSQRQLAAMFNVSRWLIQNVLHPTDRGGQTEKYSTEYWNEVKRRYRKRKQELFLSGKIRFKKRTK